jgi:hypothetical protein
MATMLAEQASDPGFFCLTKDGEDTEFEDNANQEESP